MRDQLAVRIPATECENQGRIYNPHLGGLKVPPPTLKNESPGPGDFGLSTVMPQIIFRRTFNPVGLY